MADTSRFNPRSVLQTPQPVSESEPAPAPEPKPALDQRMFRMAAWGGLLAIGVVASVAMLAFGWRNVETWSLVNASPAEQRAALTRDWSQSTSADYLETIAELSLQQPVADEASAFVAAKRATELDPTRASAWAILAYLETRQTGGTVNQVALDALTMSMEACPVCDQDLIRWRFNYVLANWAQMPEALRQKAFEQADLLRWIGPNAEFLAEMRYKAGLNGIPFDTYRAAVKTPARAWDITPVTGLRGTRQGPA